MIVRTAPSGTHQKVCAAPLPHHARRLRRDAAGDSCCDGHLQIAPHVQCRRAHRQRVSGGAAFTSCLNADDRQIAGTLACSRTFLLPYLVFSVFVLGIWLLYGWLPTFMDAKFTLNQADAAFNATAVAELNRLLSFTAIAYVIAAIALVIGIMKLFPRDHKLAAAENSHSI